MRYSLLLAFLLGGCLLPGSDGTESAVAGQDTAELSSCQLAASQIGKEGAVLEHGKRIVTFHNWIPKTGSSTEFVGFSLTVEGSSTVSYIVKSSTSSYASTAKSWLSPTGLTSSAGIANVQFCDCDCSCDGTGTGTGTGDGGGGTSGPIL